MENVRQPWAAEQWLEVTRWINDSGAAVAAGKLLRIHRTRNHSFLYCFKLLNIISFQILPTMISKHIGISLELANVQISPAKVMKKQPQCCSLTSLSGLVKEHTMPASTATHQPAHSLSSLLASWALPTLRARQVSPAYSELSLFHPARHYYASDFIWMHKQGQVGAKLRRHQKQWVNSSWISVALPTDRHHGSSKGCIPLW